MLCSGVRKNAPRLRFEWLRDFRKNTGYNRAWSLDSSDYIPVEKHDQGWRALDPVTV